MAKLAAKVRHLEASLENARVLTSVDKAKLKSKDKELGDTKAELSRLRALYEHARDEVHLVLLTIWPYFYLRKVAELKAANRGAAMNTTEELTQLRRERERFVAKVNSCREL